MTTEANAQRPLLDTVAEMTASSIARVDLPDRELMLVRLAGLIAVDAPPASYLLNLGPAVDSGLTLEDVQSALVALAPILGGPRVLDAAATIVTALGYALAIEDVLEDEEA
ncbi:MAG: carboxymuconolactone decarboxylase [Dermatophilaceae bacterium]